MSEIILYFGSFNPIHCGHISLAESVLESTEVDMLWFIVSPQNPFKSLDELADEQDRLNMVRIAIQNSKYPSRISASDIEFELPKPSWSIDTIKALENRYSDHKFSILIGSDNVADFDKWKEYKTIIDNYRIIVYPRDGYTQPLSDFADKLTYLNNVALYPQTASSIRDIIKCGQDFDCELDKSVCKYIKDNELYGFTK